MHWGGGAVLKGRKEGRQTGRMEGRGSVERRERCGQEGGWGEREPSNRPQTIFLSEKSAMNTDSVI